VITVDFQELITRYHNGEISRRGFVKQAAAFGMSASAAGLLASQAAAQESTPIATPYATGEVMISMARAEYYDHLKSHFSIEAANIVNRDIYGASPRVHNFLPQGYSGHWWIQYAWLEQN
jgi:hypothetical protein